MIDTTVRLTNIQLENFKNIKKGTIGFENNRKSFQSSILGLYGQNGSGKTALIDAIELLQWVLTGRNIPTKFSDFINIDETYACLHYEFLISGNNEEYHVYYGFKLCKKEAEVPQNTTTQNTIETTFIPVIEDEVLSYSYNNSNEKIRKADLIDTAVPLKSQKVFIPDTKYQCLVGSDKELANELLINKRIIAQSPRSFIFSKELITAVRSNKTGINNPDYRRHLRLIDSLVRYGNFELFIIKTSNTGMISLNLLPLSFKYETGTSGTLGNLLISLEETTLIPEKAVEVIEHVIANMNVVLEQIIPGLTIFLENFGEVMSKEGQKSTKIQLMSNKNGKAIPLKYESDGIKKIISILHLLIGVYNKPSMTVAIDELDSGIFEYLLGEILKIISEKGKGQLIFTSHNLRPLEVLDRGFIAFTTTNPYKRFIRLTNVKENNNLRDFYFRDIMLGLQNEEVYASANNAEIAFAFREAGKLNGS